MASLLLLAGVWAGCDLFGNGSQTEEGQPLPGGPFLVAAVDGNEPGLWLFDPETLQRTAIVDAFRDHPPKLTLTPEGRRWYATWREGSQLDGTLESVLVAFDPQSGRIVRQRATSDTAMGGSQLTYEPTRDEVVAYGDGVRFFEAATLDRTRTVPIGEEDENVHVQAAAVAGDQGVIYFGANPGGGGDLIHIYDTNRREVVDTIRLFEDEDVRARTSPTALALSPDERYLYAVTFTSFGLDGFGTFFMVDLKSGEVVAKDEAGKLAGLAVGPDGRYVYIDCPAGGGAELIPTEQVLRFDVEAREMEVFIDGAKEMGLDRNVLIADLITMLSDEGAFVIRNAIAARVRLDDDREEPSLIKVDARTGDVLATYVPPRDDRGVVTTSVWQLRYDIISK